MGLSNELSCEAGSFSRCRLTPTGVFTQRFEALFPRAGALGCVVCFNPPPFLWVYLWANVGPQDLLAVPLPAHVCSTIRHSGSRRLASSPVHPGCQSPPLLPVWTNVSSLFPWLSDFHAVRFSVSSGCFLFLNCPSFGCARRRSVSTYASILVFLKICKTYSRKILKQS